MFQPQSTSFESLESRALMSAATLTQDQATLAAAVATYKADQAQAAVVLAADRLAVVTHKPQADPAIAPLVDAWKAAILARNNTLMADLTNLRTTANNDSIKILHDRENIFADIKSGNTSQLALDKTQLGADQLQLANDRKTLGTQFINDIITTKATIAGDHEAIIAKRLADGADPAAVALRQTLINDSIHWVDTLANDRKAIFADQLIVAQDKHG